MDQLSSFLYEMRVFSEKLSIIPSKNKEITSEVKKIAREAKIK